ncbi:ATP-binding protein [Candidatus Woesearchaeota archaeon]|nr:ATP-binding protein [Candidatus Woesearchaeota archaeon]
MYIKRILEGILEQYLPKKEIIAIIGPRQSGKTTLLQHIRKNLDNAQFIDFEDRQLLELFTTDLSSFIELYVKPYKYLFIDEFQYALDGGKNLKYIYDHYSTKIIISGSSATALSIHGIKYLVGRIFIFTLYPFSFEEYLAYKEPLLFKNIYTGKTLTNPIIEKIFPYFEEFCIYGGYPRVITTENKEEKEIVLRNIYNTYFLKEVKEILNIADDYTLSRLLYVLALQVGNIINYHELAQITNLSHKQVLDKLNILEKTFMCIKSYPFYTNKRTEVVKAPKIFFFDNGFRNIVIRSLDRLKFRQDKGTLYENFVASELIKAEKQIKYWRSKSKAEVDFVLEEKRDIIPIEVKSHLTSPVTTRSFTSFLEKYKPKKAIILSEKLLAKKGKLKCIPIFYVMNEIK